MSSLNTWLHEGYCTARKLVVAILGFSVLAVGVVMLVTPGPAFVVIPLGLGILAVEFAWARRWLQKVKEKAQEAADKVRGKSGSKNPEQADNPYAAP